MAVLYCQSYTVYDSSTLSVKQPFWLQFHELTLLVELKLFCVSFGKTTIHVKLLKLCSHRSDLCPRRAHQSELKLEEAAIFSFIS